MVYGEKRKKILFFHRYPPEFELIPFPGFLEFIKALSLEYEIFYFGMSWKKPKNKELRKLMKIIEAPFNIDITSVFDKWHKTFLFYLYLPFAAYQIKKLSPDIIICRENFPFIASLLTLLKIPLLIALSDWWPSLILGKSKIGRYFAEFIEKKDVELWISKNVTVLAHNKNEVEQMLEKGIYKKRIIKIGAPLFGGVFSKINSRNYRDKFGFKDADFVVGWHGIIHPSKGIDQILLWWKKLIVFHRNWKLLLIGGTIGELECRKRIFELGIENNVKITGWIFDQAELNKYLNASDCLLTTRRNTPDTRGNTPSSLTHNLMTGKPVIATGLPGIAEVIQDGKNGFLYEPDSFESFKSKLEHISKNYKLAKKIGQRGLERVKFCFDAKRAALDYKKVIEETLNAGKLNNN
jgi:glycosyltransferase involved in cell wall biosynthesis